MSSKSIKVGYVVSTYPAASQTFVDREINAVVEAGVEVLIFSLKSRPAGAVLQPTARDLLPLTIYAGFFSANALYGFAATVAARPATFLRATIDLVRAHLAEPIELAKCMVTLPKACWFALVAKREGVTHIHAHFANVPTAVGLFIAQLAGVSFSFMCHAFDIFGAPHSLGCKLRQAHRVCVEGQFHASFLRQRWPETPPEKFLVIRNTVDVRKFTPRRQEPPGARHTPLIVSVGRLVRKKGFHILLRSLDRLRQEGVRARCVIVGDGPEKKRLERLRASLSLDTSVVLVGEVPESCVLRWLQSSHVFALPCVARGGDTDGLPTAIIEAMACALPVVTTDVAAIPELVENDVGGLIVGQRDVDGLAHALWRLIRDPGLRRRLGANARRKVEAECDTQPIVRRLIEQCFQGCRATR